MGQFDSSVDVMLFEAGALVGALHGNTQSQRLADRVELADRDAFTAGKTQFTLVLDPIECGIAIEALDSGASELGKFLASRLKTALQKVLTDNNIAYGNDFGQQNGGGQTGLGEPPAGGETPADGSSPASGLGEPSEPAPSDPAPTEPASSDPAPSDPDQSQPATDAEPVPADEPPVSEAPTEDPSGNEPAAPSDDEANKDGPQTP